MGEILVAAGDFDGAIISLSRALSLQSDNVACLVNLGMANIHLQNWPQAVDALTCAVDIAPKEAGVYARLGVAL